MDFADLHIYLFIGSQRMKLKGKMLRPAELENWEDHKANLVEGCLFMIMQ